MDKAKLALGTWSWGAGTAGGDQVFGNHKSTEELHEVFDTAMAKGLNLWDTATVYGMGASEDILGSFARTVDRDDIVLSTKFTPQIAGAYGDSMEAMLDASLERLGTDYVDLYWIHNPEDGVKRWTADLAPLVKSGKVRTVGVSNHNLDQIKEAARILADQGVRLSAVQNHFSLLYRDSEDAGILDWCAQNGVDFFAYMTLEQGALSGKYSSADPLPADSQRGQTYNPLMPRIDKLVKAMGPIAETHGVHVAQVPVAWAIAKGATPIIGVTSPAQVDDAAAAVACKLTPEEMDALERAARATGVNTRGGWERPMA